MLSNIFRTCQILYSSAFAALCKAKTLSSKHCILKTYIFITVYKHHPQSRWLTLQGPRTHFKLGSQSKDLQIMPCIACVTLHLLVIDSHVSLARQNTIFSTLPWSLGRQVILYILYYFNFIIYSPQLLCREGATSRLCALMASSGAAAAVATTLVSLPATHGKKCEGVSYCAIVVLSVCVLIGEFGCLLRIHSIQLLRWDSCIA